MPALTNTRHELFAQQLAKGVPASRAYVTAGYKADDGASCRLSGNIKVRARVHALLEPSILKTGLTVQGLMEQYRAIALADRSKLVGWDGDPRTFPAELGPCVERMERDKKGRLKVRFCNRLDAMRALGRMLGMFDRGVNVSVRGDLAQEMTRALARKRAAASQTR